MKNKKTASVLFSSVLGKTGKTLPTKPKPARTVVTPANEAIIELIGDMFLEARASEIAETLNLLLNEFFADYDNVDSTNPAVISRYVFTTTSLCKFFTRLQTLHAKLKPRDDR